MDNRMTKFLIASFLMVAAGLAGLVMTVLVFKNRLGGIDTSLILTIFAGLLMLAWSLLNIYAGIQGIRIRSRRSRTAKIARFTIISVILCVAGLTLSAINGIIVSHLAVIVITGLVIPMFFILAGLERR